MANKDGYKDRKHYKSQLLEDFRSRNRKIEFSELRDHIVEFSQDQHGSRFIQQKFETASVDEKNLIFEEIMPHALELIVDVFGNQVIQRLLEHGDTNQRKVLGEKIKGHVLEFSLQMYGCRVIQKAVEVVEYTQKFLLAQELSHNVIRCVEDQNGNHVIQKIIEFVGKNDEHINLVVNAFRGRSQEMAVHPQGCRVMQRMLEHCSQRVMTPIIEEIIPYVIALSEDQQGNYAIQHILQFGSDQQVAYVYKQVAGKILQMSMHKQASNVIEKTLVFGKLFQKKGILDEIVWDDEMNTTLVTMMKDMYANQVIQKSIELAEGEQLNVILRCVKEQAPNLRKFTQGRHIVGYVEKMMFTNKI